LNGESKLDPRKIAMKGALTLTLAEANAISKGSATVASLRQPNPSVALADTPPHNVHASRLSSRAKYYAPRGSA
jgi:hypothetical protein